MGTLWGYLGPSWAILGPSWGHLGVILGHLGGLGGVLGPTLGFRIYKVKFDHNNACLFEMQNRSRLTPVQRKRPPEKRRCYEALKLHALWKCKNRSRTTPVRRKRSSVQPPVQKGRSVSAAGKPATKLSIIIELWGRRALILGV